MNENAVENKEPPDIMESLFYFLHCLWIGGLSLMSFAIGLEYFIKDFGTLGDIFGYGYGITIVLAIVALIVGGFLTLLCCMSAAIFFLDIACRPIKNQWIKGGLGWILLILSLGGPVWLIWKSVESPQLQGAVLQIILLLFGLAIAFTIIQQAVENIKATLVGLAVMVIGIGGCIWQLWEIGQQQAWFISRGFLPIPLIVVFAILTVAGFGLMFKEK
jgi:hypothetical protein